MDGWMDGWMDRERERECVCVYMCVSEREREWVSGEMVIGKIDLVFFHPLPQVKYPECVSCCIVNFSLLISAGD